MDFSSLFGQLQEMKQRVSSMSPDQRKACAEQAVLAFWKAIGGDDEEIDIPEDGWLILNYIKMYYIVDKKM